MQYLLPTITAVLLLMPGPCAGCLWDTDTVAMERERFPTANELIAGLFGRHSQEYYQWRIADRSAKPIDQRSPEDYDDIAVAHDKLGQHDEAIDVILEKMKRLIERKALQFEREFKPTLFFRMLPILLLPRIKSRPP